MSNKMNTPWRIAKFKGSDCVDILDCDDAIVEECLFQEPATYIVRCVNAHEDLVEALERLEKIAGTAPMYDDPARVKARVALAAATGEQK